MRKGERGRDRGENERGGGERGEGKYLVSDVDGDLSRARDVVSRESKVDRLLGLDSTRVVTKELSRGHGLELVPLITEVGEVGHVDKLVGGVRGHVGRVDDAGDVELVRGDVDRLLNVLNGVALQKELWYVL